MAVSMEIPMKIGLDDHMILAAGIQADALELLDRADKLGLRGVHYSTLNSFKSISPSYLSEIKSKADALGFYLEVGMGTCNPYSDCRAARDTNRDPRESFKKLIPIAKTLGSPVIRTFFGFIKERFFKHVTLREQIEATVKVLKDVKELAEEYQIKITLENHLELTSDELIGLIKTVDSESIGVCFDTGNTLGLLEDPVEACKKLLPYIYTTHVKDGIIYSTDEGASWVGTTLGEGFVDLPSIFKLIHKAHPEVTFNLEDLPDIFPIPFFDKNFLVTLKHLDTLKMVEILKLLRKSDDMIRSGKFSYIKELSGPNRCRIVENRISDNVKNAKSILKHLGVN